MSRKIEVQILGDSKSLEAALGRAQTKTSSFGKALSIGAKVGAGALLGLGVAAKIGFDEFTQSQKVMKQTQAVLKSTGGAAGVTAGHVNDMAQSLLNLSGVDDETIQAGENMLLTFRNIHNEAGRTNDVFDQATKATLDLSVAMGKDMSSSAILVGKALNDPVKGITALRRVGVQFTDDQTKLIKKLVETGNTAEAQKLILGELNQEFGGSAEAAGKTLPAQLTILKEHFADVAATLVKSLMPSLNSLIGVLSGVVGWMKQNQEATKIIVVTIAALSAGVIVVNAVYKTWAAVTKVVAAAQWLLNAALDANPVVLIAAGIIALGVALVIAYKKSKTFRDIVNAAFNSVKAVAAAAWSAIKSAANTAWGVIQPIVSHLASFLRTIRDLLGWLKKNAGSAFGALKSGIHAVSGVVSSVLGPLKSALDGIISAMKWIMDNLARVKNAVSSFVGGGAQPIQHPVGPHPGTTTNPGVAGRGSFVIRNVIVLDGQVVHESVRKQDKVYRRQNGRSAFA